MLAVVAHPSPAGTPPKLSPNLILQSWHMNMHQPLVLLLLVLALVGFVTWLYITLRSEQGTVNTGGMSYVVGPMGSGKSMFGVRTILRAVRQGKYAVTNVRLLPGWEHDAARKLYPRARGVQREQVARKLLALYIYEPSLVQAMRFRLPCAYCGGDVLVVDDASRAVSDDPSTCNHVGPENESRAVCVWDETHNDLNNRTWDGSTASDRDAVREDKRQRARIVTWCTQLRKLGYSGYLLSQHHENTDAQLRRVCNYIIRLQNQRTRGIGVLLPKRFALFLVYWYPAHLGDGTTRVQSVRKERYFLPWHRRLYNSWELFADLADHGDPENAPIYLPAGGWYDRESAGRGPRAAGLPGLADAASGAV